MSATLAFEEIGVGDALDELVVPITATRVVAGAIATRDFMPVHHDRDYANHQGAPDIFMNILSTNAYCCRYLTDWAGPNAMVTHLAIRLGVPCMPGSTLTFNGTVTGLEERDGAGFVTVEFAAVNSMGAHASGTATFSLPLTRDF